MSLQGTLYKLRLLLWLGNMKVSFKGRSCECCTAILIIVVPSILIFSELRDAESYEVNREKNVWTDYVINHVMV